MGELIKELERFGDLTSSFTLLDVAAVFLLSLVLSLFVGWVYRTTHRGVSFSQSYVHTLVIFGIAVAFVMLIIGSNIARAFTLVGALSIVRFRTAIKDPEELIYLFMAIAIGLGLGADQQVPTVVAVLALLVLVIATRLLTRRSSARNLYLNLQVPEGETTDTFQAVNDILVRNARFVDMRRLDRRAHTLQLPYLVDCQDDSELCNLMDELKTQLPGSTFSFVDQRTTPG